LFAGAGVGFSDSLCGGRQLSLSARAEGMNAQKRLEDRIPNISALRTRDRVSLDFIALLWAISDSSRFLVACARRLVLHDGR
jgi:hypothetical protein